MLLIQGPAPQLEMFTLTSSRYQRPKGLPAGDLFHGQAPRLMSLNAPELTLSWDLLSLSSLEHLSIADHNGENSQWALRYHRLFHSFENIRSICIDRGEGFLDLGRQATVLDIIKLPSLESLGLLKLSSAISTTILSFLSSCNIEELVISGLPFEPDVLGSLAALDRETVFPSLLSKVTHMHIRQMQLSIVTKGSIADMPNVLNPSKTFIPFAFGVHGARALTAPSLNSLLSTLFRFSSPLSLCFQGISFFRRQILATQLPLLGFIEELTLRGENLSPGMQYDNVDDILQSLSATPILCPGLRKLTLERVNFQGQVLLDLVKFRCSPRAATNDADANGLARLEVLTISHYPGDMDYSLIPEIQRHVEQEGKFILTWPLF
ncbi:hypothetical protein FRC02_009488 [Tulasnella sp. 418]|nr:hypothetical protein FRC02_009488 [Tulasnella sp. 418]